MTFFNSFVTNECLLILGPIFSSYIFKGHVSHPPKIIATGSNLPFPPFFFTLSCVVLHTKHAFCYSWNKTWCSWPWDLTQILTSLVATMEKLWPPSSWQSRAQIPQCRFTNMTLIFFRFYIIYNVQHEYENSIWLLILLFYCSWIL